MHRLPRYSRTTRMCGSSSENEPSSGDNADFVTETQGIYNAVRATGNNNIVVFNGTGNLSVDPSVFSSMTNVVWDQHYYNWETNYSSDEGTIAAQIASDKAMIAAFFSGPYAIFEYGDSTSGQGNTGDNGGAETLRMVENAVTTGEIAGDAYFQWYSEGIPPWTVDSIFSSQGGGAFEGNSSTCAVGGGPPTGCGSVAAAWIATSQEPVVANSSQLAGGIKIVDGIVGTVSGSNGSTSTFTPGQVTPAASSNSGSVPCGGSSSGGAANAGSSTGGITSGSSGATVSGSSGGTVVGGGASGGTAAGSSGSSGGTVAGGSSGSGSSGVTSTSGTCGSAN